LIGVGLFVLGLFGIASLSLLVLFTRGPGGETQTFVLGTSDEDRTPSAYHVDQIRCAEPSVAANEGERLVRRLGRYEEGGAIVREMLVQKRFDEVDALLQGLLDAGVLTRNGFLYAGSLIQEACHHASERPALGASLDEWVATRPSSSMAYTFRGSFNYKYAWDARSGRRASEVQGDQWTLMRERAALMRRDLMKAAELDTRNPIPPWLLVAGSRLTGDDQGFVEEWFQRAVELRPCFAQVYMHKIHYLMPKWGNESSDAAMVGFARAVTKAAPRGSALPHLVLLAHHEAARSRRPRRAEYLAQPEVWNEIKAATERLMEDFPQSGIWPSRYAELASWAKRRDEARRFHEMALERDAGSVEVRYERGEFLRIHDKDFDTALEEYTAALAIDPLHLNALEGRMRTHYKLGQYEHVEQLCQQMLARDPHDPDVVSYFAAAARERGNYRQAIERYGLLIELQPQKASNFNKRGAMHHKAGSYQKAVEDYTRAIELDSEYAVAYENRALAYAKLGLLDKSRDDRRWARRLRQD
jgi:tetratricopeptide (TPR) repeat protein